MSNTRLSFNVPGPFYTGERCEGCGQCIRFAPDHLTFDQSEVFCYVYRQPVTHAEVASVRQAMELCPSSAMREMTDGMQGRAS
ncbi:MAG: ferredoxin [Acidobacteriota bacterium]